MTHEDLDELTTLVEREARDLLDDRLEPPMVEAQVKVLNLLYNMVITERQLLILQQQKEEREAMSSQLSRFDIGALKPEGICGDPEN